MNNIKMLYIFYKIDVSEGTNVNKTSGSKEYDICHYQYFLYYSFKFQPNVCKRCHDLLMTSMNLSYIFILNIKGHDYHCIITVTSKSKAINYCKIVTQLKKVEHYKKSKNCKLKKYIKTFESIYKNGNKKYKICWYWNRKPKISPTQKTYFNKKKIDINEIVVPNEVYLGKMSVYTRAYDETKCFLFSVKDYELLDE